MLTYHKVCDFTPIPRDILEWLYNTFGHDTTQHAFNQLYNKEKKSQHHIEQTPRMVTKLEHYNKSHTYKIQQYNMKVLSLRYVLSPSIFTNGELTSHALD